MIHQEQSSFETTGHRHMADVTDQVAAIVGRSGVKTGIVQVFCVGSTAAVGTIEFEPGLERDYGAMVDVSPGEMAAAGEVVELVAEVAVADMPRPKGEGKLEGQLDGCEEERKAQGRTKRRVGRLHQVDRLGGVGVCKSHK